jgi:hypothetical protein
VADREHAVLELNLGNVPEVKHATEVVPVRHSLPPVFRAIEREQFPVAIFNKRLTA